MGGFADWLLSLPSVVKWALAIAGVLLGLSMILWPERIVCGLRKWLLIQLRWLRSPRYLRFLGFYGWLLLATGASLALLLVVRGR